jgi:hypothetical protein
MIQALYAHMNNKRKRKKNTCKKNKKIKNKIKVMKAVYKKKKCDLVL